mmetsp:Transcript_12466/g.39409  ORF Transcript_12466/g.39409 Transcript_12466/m.39409 type:complete len:240 (-) Transcript_12466:514-1233(-)
MRSANRVSSVSPSLRPCCSGSSRATAQWDHGHSCSRRARISGPRLRLFMHSRTMADASGKAGSVFARNISACSTSRSTISSLTYASSGGPPAPTPSTTATNRPATAITWSTFADTWPDARLMLFVVSRAIVDQDGRDLSTCGSASACKAALAAAAAASAGACDAGSERRKSPCRDRSTVTRLGGHAAAAGTCTAALPDAPAGAPGCVDAACPSPVAFAFCSLACAAACACACACLSSSR